MNKKTFKLPDEIKKNVDLIRGDNKNGSLYLTKKSIELIKKIVTQHMNTYGVEEIEKLVENTAVTLVDAQPSMASIFTFANQLLLHLDGLGSVGDLSQIIDFCNDFNKKIDDNVEKISFFTAEMIRDDSFIMTFSNSETVLKSFINAAKKDKKFRVLCSESRPMNEGVQFAKKLDEKCVSVSLVVDSALFSFMEDVDFVIVGADSITNKGFVNKTGTLGLAIAAKEFNKDFFVLASSEKMIPRGYVLNYTMDRNPREVLPTSFGGIEVINRYFEFIPLEYLSGVVTEIGVKNVLDIKKYIENLKLHDYFHQKNRG